MKQQLLCKYLDYYFMSLNNDDEKDDLQERNGREIFYKNYDYNRIINMLEDEFYDYISKL